MKIQARILLNLPSSFNTFKFTYNTYEPATYDQYLAASIVKNTDSINFAHNYIDEITGKGSLNLHFKKLVDKIFNLDENVLNKVLENSIYPITKIDKSNHFKYYPYFNISIMNNSVYSGNLADYSTEVLKEKLYLSYDIIKKDCEIGGIDRKKETYDAVFSDDGVKIKLLDSWYSLDESQLSESYKDQIDDINKYHGIINNHASGDGWFILTNSVLNNLCNPSIKGFFNSDGNFITIMNEALKTTTIVNVFGLYFYQEYRSEYNKSNSSLCDQVIDYLFKTNSINEIKTKTILKLLDSVDDLKAQQVVNYILLRKESKDIALYGLNLIKLHLEKGWEKETLLSIKKFINKSDLNIIYRLNIDLNFTESELIEIDNDILTEGDRKRKIAYLAERDNIIKEINYKIGEVTNSGIRERMKSIKSSELTKRLTKRLKKMVGHKKEDIANYNDDQLKEYYKQVNDLYDDYLEISKIL